ncbi:MAG: FtsX-like permease family protein [Betaproteobacteria bacterium]|nr:FtsX-like permease family protein [Betaproteobacteria bacterium]
MVTLDRKLVRDLWRMRGHLTAVAVVACCGVAVFVTMQSAYDALVRARADYYDRFRFADVFATLTRAPVTLLPRLRAVSGVASVDDRIVQEVTLDVPDFTDPATALVVSVPDEGRPLLNDVFIRSGRYPEPDARDEVLVSESFAHAHGLRPGGTLAAVINGRWQSLRIAGIANSPEFVYVIGGAGVFPDDRRYGVVWMTRTALGSALDMRDGFNSVAIRLAPGADERSVIDGVDEILRPYGSPGAYGRDEQVSHAMLDGEIRQDRVTGIVVPAIFLAVAAFLVHNVLMRLIALQRGQIGVLKAFGYPDGRIAAHYLKLALAAVVAGAAAGVALGDWFGGGLAAMYQRFFHFPTLAFELSARNIALVVAIAVAAAVAGAWPALRRALALPPAEAMRSESPPTYRPLLLERLGLASLLTPVARMWLRALERRPLRAVAAILAVGFSCALLVVGQFGLDALEETVRLQFREARRDDVRVALREARGPSVEQDLAHLPGVTRVEAMRVTVANVRNGPRWKRVTVMGLRRDGELHRIVDARGAEIPVPANGAVLSASLARILRTHAGASVELDFLERRRRQVHVQVAAVVDEPIGLFVYLERDELSRLMGEGPGYTGAYLRVDHDRLGELYDRLKHLPAVSGVTLREATIRSFLATIAENIRISVTILIAFACTIAAGVVYNGARIALSEQATTLASLRVLGFTRGEVSAILLGEQAVLTAIGIPAGLLIGYALCGWLAHLLETDLYRLPLALEATTYGYAGATVVLAAVVSGLAVAWRVRHLDLVAVLKSRE